MRFWNLAVGSNRPTEESDAGGQLFVNAEFHLRAGDEAFVPASLMNKRIPFDVLVLAVAERLAVLDAAAEQERKAERAAKAKVKARA
jgi:hypothetical protein